MTVPRLMLLTGIAPGRVDVGRIYLRDLCLAYPKDRICCFCVERPNQNMLDQELQYLPMAFAQPPNEWGTHIAGDRFTRLSRPVYERYIETVKLPRLVKQAISWGRTHQVDLVWVPLHSSTTIRMACRVAEGLGVPLITTIWDTPRYKLDGFGLDNHSLGRLLKQFEYTISRSLRCGVASDEMKKQYESDYGTPCVVMIRGVERRRIFIPPIKDSQSPIVIGYAGSIYAHDTWNSLIEALSSRSWTIAGRKVVLRILSSHLDLSAHNALNIEFLGWRSTDDTVAVLSTSDLAYLPYWFDANHEEIVRLAFPSKLATYVAAQVPIFYHGPLVSSPVQFLKRYPVGVACNSLDSIGIITELEAILGDNDRLATARSACNDAYENELSASAFITHFAELLGISESDLTVQRARS